ncbi:hypothetical protein FKP32DRAFT_1613104 [Trametes sanguinea]|nr:hypothetical protein FKP32DRAFT_1613104 [Trametes sanguinea]
MSCLLFNLAIEPLAVALRASPLRGLPIPGIADRLVTMLFADDTTVYLSADDDYAVLSGILERWCRASCAKFNTLKTEVIPFGSTESRSNVVTNRGQPGRTLRIPDDVRVLRDGESTRMLGAWIGNHADPTTAWNPVVSRIRANLERWNTRNVTMHAKKLLVGLELGSRTQFLAAAQGMPAAIEKELQTIVSRFMWGEGKKPAIAMSLLHQSVEEGGLGLLNLTRRNDAIHLMWLSKYLDFQNHRPKWAYLTDKLFANAADTPMFPTVSQMTSER